MKKFRLILISLTAVLLLSGCEKKCKIGKDGQMDDKGQWITYHQDKTGYGYVYYGYFNSSDSIVFTSPVKNAVIEVASYHSRGGELFGVLEHVDLVYTDTNGRYSFNFLKTIDCKKCTHYYISPLNADAVRVNAFPIHFYINADDIQNQNIFIMDTCMMLP